MEEVIENKLTHSEYCALKLLKLCASPLKMTQMSKFDGCLDASGNKYRDLFIGLQKKGKIYFGKGWDKGTRIHIR